MTWWSEGVLIDDTDDVISDTKVKNLYNLDNIGRRHLNSKIECQATNSPLLSPLVVQLSIEVLRKYYTNNKLCVIDDIKRYYYFP